MRDLDRRLVEKTRCDLCGKSFESETKLKKHKVSDHNDLS